MHGITWPEAVPTVPPHPGETRGWSGEKASGPVALTTGPLAFFWGRGSSIADGIQDGGRFGERAVVGPTALGQGLEARVVGQRTGEGDFHVQGRGLPVIQVQGL